MSAAGALYEKVAFGLLLGGAIYLVTYAWWEKRQVAKKIDRERRSSDRPDNSQEDG